MTPQLDKVMRSGGMSRRGFLRMMGVTAAAVLVPGVGMGLVVPQPRVATGGMTGYFIMPHYKWIDFSPDTVKHIEAILTSSERFDICKIPSRCVGVQVFNWVPMNGKAEIIARIS